MELLSEIHNRSTAKEFSEGAVDEASVHRILKAGRMSPSAKNRQAWRFLVIQDREMRKKMMEASYGDERFLQAPLAIAACTTNIGYRMPNGELSYPVDISFAVSFMMLQAEHENLGSAIITTFQQDKIKNLLTIPYSMKVLMILLIGQKGEISEQKVRLPENRVVAYDHW